MFGSTCKFDHPLAPQADGYTPEMPEETTQGGLGVNVDIYFSEIPTEQGPEASSSSKKRKRASAERDDMYIEAMKDLGKMIDLSINSVTDKLCDMICASIDRSVNDSVLIAEELRKVEGLTTLDKELIF
ncbi:uncharacterized protein G2W53_015331 [Senna tora]|uniref:Uncharacterized protein n=1 Tax=Senna tora TaxID=362788 RepID=A0A834WVB0_9FABA|nr:uncharacterized protein G2W53_015331 [Senna tora]